MSANNHSNTQQPARRVRGESAWRSPWVWGMFILVAVMLIANLALIYFGATTSTGLVVEDFYDRGKNYFNDAGKHRDEQKRLGWQMNLQAPDVPTLGLAQPYRITVVDRDGYPVSNAQVELAVFRPNDAKKDFTVVLTEMERGKYSSNVTFDWPGNWDLLVSVKHGTDHLDIARRIFVEK